jgi:ribonucleotide reductase alpha subunit
MSVALQSQPLYQFELADAKFSKRGLDSKIGWDRYSYPDHNLDNYKAGDRVVAIVGDKGEKEVATILFVNRKTKKLKIKTVTGLKAYIDAELALKPLELTPAEWFRRWSTVLAVAESGGDPDKFAKWINEFRWMTDRFRISFGGRVMLALGQEYVGVTDEEIAVDIAKNRVTLSNIGGKAPLTLYNCYVGESPIGSSAYWNSIDKKDLYTPKSVNIYQDGKNKASQVEGSEDARTQFKNVNNNARKEAHIMRRGGGYGINISYIETVAGAGITKEDVVIYIPQTHKDYSEALDRRKIKKFGQHVTLIHTEQELNEYLAKGYVRETVGDDVDQLFDGMDKLIDNAFDGIKAVYDFSGVRHRNALVLGINGRSSGAVSWAEMYELYAMLLSMPEVDAVDFAEVASFVVHLIQQGGSRRGALMEILETFRRDILKKFIERKKEKDNLGKGRWLTGANISLGIDETFMAIVNKANEALIPVINKYAYERGVEPADENGKHTKEDEVILDECYKLAVEYILGGSFLTDIEKEVFQLWVDTIQSAWQSAEPGVVYLERYNNMSNSWYFHEIIATNPCGEQGLPAWGVCNLAHITLPNFWNPITKSMDWAELERAVRLGIRAQDLIIDYTPYFLQENYEVQMKERRLGQGTMGLGSVLVMAGIRYGEEAVDFINELFSRISFWQNDESANLAAEKGAFPAFELEKFLASGHMQQLSMGWLKHLPEEFNQARVDFVEKLMKTGIRNVTQSTQAPTGSTSTMLDTFFKELGWFDMTGGIEPFFDWTYWRAGRLGVDPVNAMVVERYRAEHGENAPLPTYFVNAQRDLAPEDHIYVQAAVQYWTDSSISKTANCPEDYTVYQTYRLYVFSYNMGLKGMTIYRDKCRDAQVLSTDREGAKIEAHIEAEAINHIHETERSGLLAECPACGEKSYNKAECVCYSCGASVCSM